MVVACTDVVTWVQGNWSLMTELSPGSGRAVFLFRSSTSLVQIRLLAVFAVVSVHVRQLVKPRAPSAKVIKVLLLVVGTCKIEQCERRWSSRRKTMELNLCCYPFRWCYNSQEERRIWLDLRLFDSPFYCFQWSCRSLFLPKTTRTTWSMLPDCSMCVVSNCHREYSLACKN